MLLNGWKQKRLKTIVSTSNDETIQIGREFAATLAAGAIVCLEGDLGAGKTTFVKGLVQQITRLPTAAVTSPTFVYLNIYGERERVYHFDLYRVRDTQEFLERGFDEYFFTDAVCCIEWSERIADCLPQHCHYVHFSHSADGCRDINIYETTKP